MQIVTKASLTSMIRTAASEEQLARIIGRACLALFKRQTEAERADNNVKVQNNRGFMPQDAKKGSITAKYFIKHGTLMDWQVRQWTNVNEKGEMRIVKYWRQLNEEAVARKAAS